MTPCVAPLIVIFTMTKSKKQQESPFIPAGYLLTGYFLVWAGFSLLVTILQWFLQQISLFNPEMETTDKILKGGIIIFAGVFQFSPLKKRCFHHWYVPANFVEHNWKEKKEL